MPHDSGTVFKGECPLWTYVLAETVEESIDFATSDGVQPIPTGKLRLIGGRIVAETFAGLMPVTPPPTSTSIRMDA